MAVRMIGPVGSCGKNGCSYISAIGVGIAAAAAVAFLGGVWVAIARRDIEVCERMARPTTGCIRAALRINDAIFSIRCRYCHCEKGVRRRGTFQAMFYSGCHLGSLCRTPHKHNARAKLSLASLYGKAQPSLLADGFLYGDAAELSADCRIHTLDRYSSDKSWE